MTTSYQGREGRASCYLTYGESLVVALLRFEKKRKEKKKRNYKSKRKKKKKKEIIVQLRQD